MAYDYLGKSGSAVRPYGYEAQQQLDATTTSITWHIASDTFLLGVTVSLGIAGTGSFFLESSKSTHTAIDAGTAVWTDMVGNGTDPQTAVTKGTFDADMNAVRVRRISGSPLVEVTGRRN